MPSAWTLYTFTIPAPIVFLVLLNIRYPVKLRKKILAATERLLGTPMIAGKVNLLQLALIITGLTLLNATGDIVKARHLLAAEFSTGGTSAAAAAVLGHAYASPPPTLLMKRFRAERNWWLSCLSFGVWAGLFRFFTLMQQLDLLEEQVGSPLGIEPVEREVRAHAADLLLGTPSKDQKVIDEVELISSV